MRATAVALVIALCILPAMATAAERSISYGSTSVHETVGMGSYYGFIFSLKAGDLLEVKLSEVSSIRLDFYFTNYTAYLAYKNAIPGYPFDFPFIGGDSVAQNSPAIEFSYRALKADKMVVIIDNNNRTSEGARSLGDVEVLGSINIREYIWNMKTIAIVAGIGFIFFIIIAVAMRSKRKYAKVARRPHHEEPHKPRRFFVRRRVKPRPTQKPHPQQPRPGTMSAAKKPQPAPLVKKPVQQAQPLKKSPTQPPKAPHAPAQRQPNPEPRKALSPKKRMPGR